MKKLTKLQKMFVVAGRFCIIGFPGGGGFLCWD